MTVFQFDTMPAHILIPTRPAKNDGRPAPGTVVIAMLWNADDTRTALPRRFLNKQLIIVPGRIRKVRMRVCADTIAYAYLSQLDECREAALYDIAHGNPRVLVSSRKIATETRQRQHRRRHAMTH